MSTNTNRQPATWLNPSVLKWAREWRQRSVEDAASYIQKKPQHILDWESGIGAPTVKQARKLAHYYGRSFLEFFLPSPPTPSEPTAIPDFRFHKDASTDKDGWDLQQIQLWAEAQRLNALDLLRELGQEPPVFPTSLLATLKSDPERLSSSTRDTLAFSIENQIEMTKTEAIALPNILRKRFESVGILTLKHPSLREHKVRGICIAESPLPTIVVSKEAPTAQAFTLMHEFGHVLLGQSAVTGIRSRPYSRQPVERWCDRFAAAFLMPEKQISVHFGARPTIPAPSIPDGSLVRLADTFRVSPHAMLIRLVHLGYVQADYYWKAKKPQFDKDEAEEQSFGRSPYYGVRFRSALGDFYTGLVLEAWDTGRITNHNAAEYMGIKRLDHLYAIRDRFRES